MFLFVDKRLVYQTVRVPGTTSGGTINEIQDTTTNRPVGR